MEGLSEFARQRLEKDLKELERMIKDHFETRKKDEADLASLQERIEKRQIYREEQNKIRAEREKARQEAAIVRFLLHTFYELQEVSDSFPLGQVFLLHY